MKRKYPHILLAGVFLFFLLGCVDNNISFEQQINVAEGIYISGQASEFSSEVPKGRLKNIKDSVLFELNVWLRNSGGFKISFTGIDGVPVAMGMGEQVESGNPDVKTYHLQNQGKEFTVEQEGPYKIIVNKNLQEVHLIPLRFKIQSEMELTEEGSTTLALSHVSYDRLTHLVTWTSGDKEQSLLSSEYHFSSGDSVTIQVGDHQSYTLPSFYTGTSHNVRTNVLTNEYAELTDASSVNLKLKHKGNYIVSVQYSILTEEFAAKMTGSEIIEPEAEGYPMELYLGGENFGAWNTDHIVKMVPVGKAGNGAFWAIKRFTAGKSIQWATDRSGSEAFSSLTSNVNLNVDEQGNATVKESGFYMVYVDLHRKLISFETPEIYGIGECFGGDETLFTLSGNAYTAQTTSLGNLRMFATSKYNDREWDSMEFTSCGGQIVYRGTNVSELEPVPVAKDIPIDLDWEHDVCKFVYTLNPENIPTSASAVYMTGDGFGNLNWGSPHVETFDRSYSEDYRWIYVNFLAAGTRLLFSTEKCFGETNFVALNTNEGYTVEDDKAVIPADGIYMIYIDLSLRMIYVQEVSVYGYVGSTRVVFTKDANGKTMSATLPGDGRLRIYARIPILTTLSNPTFGDWKRELYVDLDTYDLSFRKPGSDEPNKDYEWKAGTQITLDFPNKKGMIVFP